jgi:hypothetical protein
LGCTTPGETSREIGDRLKLKKLAMSLQGCRGGGEYHAPTALPLAFCFNLAISQAETNLAQVGVGTFSAAIKKVEFESAFLQKVQKLPTLIFQRMSHQIFAIPWFYSVADVANMTARAQNCWGQEAVYGPGFGFGEQLSGGHGDAGDDFGYPL